MLYIQEGVKPLLNIKYCVAVLCYEQVAKRIANILDNRIMKMMEKEISALEQEKERARKSAKSRLSFLTFAYKREASEFIAGHIMKSREYRDARCVMLYVSTDSEPGTEALITDILKSGKRAVLPRCLGKGTMEAVEIKDISDLVPGKYGIPEPGPECMTVKPADINLCLVPCLAAGPDENMKYVRLGHGAGYYDRFLPALNCPTAVLCFGEMVRRVPMGKWDVPLDMLVTERGIFQNGNV